MHHLALTDSAFSRWAALLESRIGVQVTPAWEGHVRRTLDRQLQQRPHELSPKQRSVWWRELVDRLLINETAFFRHRPSFEHLSRILEKKRQQSLPQHGLRLWSAGCASGEEACSLAITASLALGESGEFEVLGTDLSTPALASARSARYRAAALDNLSTQEKAFFEPCGDVFCLKTAMRGRIHYLRHNLVASQWPRAIGEFDVIFCQHLLVYFEPRRRAEMVARLSCHLKPGGSLVLGPGEYLACPSPGLRRDSQRDVLAFVRPSPGEMEH